MPLGALVLTPVPSSVRQRLTLLSGSRHVERLVRIWPCRAGFPRRPRDLECHLQPSARDWRLAFDDVSRSLTAWHVWALLGVSDIRLRYKRSRFGQFWITLSMAFFVAGIGAVYGGLFHQNIHDYIPYLAVNMTVWTFISTTISDGTSTFIEASPYLRQEALPKTSFVMRVMVRNLVALGHNLVIIPLVFIVFLLRAEPGGAAGHPGPAHGPGRHSSRSSISLGILCTRFRDMPQIVANLLQLAFFVTPIMWHVEQLGPNAVYDQGLQPLRRLPAHRVGAAAGPRSGPRDLRRGP